MRNILAIGLFIIACLFVVSCKEEDTSLQGKMGYLRLDVATVSSTNTKSAVPENYNPKQLHVEIKDASGNIVKRTDNFDLEWKGEEMMLPPGIIRYPLLQTVLTGTPRVRVSLIIRVQQR